MNALVLNGLPVAEYTVKESIMSVREGAKTRIRVSLKEQKPKAAWHTINNKSNSLAEWSFVASVIILFIGALFAFTGFAPSGPHRINQIILVSVLLISGSVILIWSIFNIGKSYANKMLYAKIKSSVPLPYTYHDGKIQITSAFENALFMIYEVFVSIIGAILAFHVLQPWKYPLVSVILIFMYMCAVLFVYGNEKYVRILNGIPLSRELFAILRNILNTIKYLISLWYQRFIKFEIGEVLLHPRERTYIICNIPYVFNPQRMSITLICSENLLDVYRRPTLNHNAVIFQQVINDVDTRENRFIYHLQQNLDMQIPDKAVFSFKSNNNMINWYLSYRLYFKYLHWMEWRFPLIITPSNVREDMLWTPSPR